MLTHPVSTCVHACVAISPGSDNSTKDHGKHGHFNWCRESLSEEKSLDVTVGPRVVELYKCLLADASTFSLHQCRLTSAGIPQTPWLEKYRTSSEL